MANQISAVTPSVIIRNHRPVTTSIAVAKFFGKQHKNVIQKIETLDCSSGFASANFSADVQTIKIGNGATRESKTYQMTKDGFVFLVMGFTGKKAAAFKEAYIAEFNRMEKQLRHSAPCRPPAPPLSASAMKDLKYIVWLTSSQFHYRDAWSFGVWHALRKAAGRSAPQPFTVEDIPALAQELRRIMAVTTPADRMIRNFERALLKRVVREGDSAAFRKMAAMMEKEASAILSQPEQLVAPGKPDLFEERQLALFERHARQLT